VYHYVRDEACLVLLASGDKKLLLDLRKLVGLVVANKDANALPRHKQQWQLLQRLEWLERCDSGERVPIVGDASHFVINFAHHREDMLTFDASRLRQFLNGGWIWSNTVKVFEISQKGNPYRWRLVDAPPAADEFFPLSSGFAPPKVCSPNVFLCG
jgi:hypothetical protein